MFCLIIFFSSSQQNNNNNMKSLLEFNILRLLLLLLCAKSLLPTTLEPSSSEPVEADFAYLENKFVCLLNGTLDKEYVLFARRKLGNGSFYAIVPNSMNTTLKFDVTIPKYDPEAAGLEGFDKYGLPPRLAIATIKSKVSGTIFPGHANSCIPLTKEMFGHNCTIGEEIVNCTFSDIKKPLSCKTKFKAECNVDGKQIMGRSSYKLLELKLLIKNWGPCGGVFSLNATELHLLINKTATIPSNKKMQNTTLDKCVEDEILTTTDIPSLNKTDIFVSISTSKSTSTKISSALPTSASNTTKIAVTTKPTKKSLSIKDCLKNPILILLVVIFICCLAALGFLLFRFFTKPKEPEKVDKVVDEKTVVVEDGKGLGGGEGSKKEENKANKFMALKTIGMEADENKPEDLGETGLTNIADDSEL
ncbi:hypothetical protein ACQ4LE_008195, partial [Meloidogyne hapla]